MSSQDESRENWTRITLRIPPKLHGELLRHAGVLSLNASIVQRLEKSLTSEAEVAEVLNQARQLRDAARAELHAASDRRMESLKNYEIEAHRGAIASQHVALEEVKKIVEDTVREVITNALRIREQ